jgi:flagellar export protein FliJ
MKKFQFRLEVVERHRKIQEQEKQVQLAKSLERMRNTESRLLEEDMKEVQARREFSGLGSPGRHGKVSSSDFWLLDQFIRGQKVRRVDIKQTLEIQEQSVRESYRDFLHARQQHKIMEKLREKRFKQFSEERRKHEQRSIDELYVTRNKVSGNESDDGEGGNHEE